MFQRAHHLHLLMRASVAQSVPVSQMACPNSFNHTQQRPCHAACRARLAQRAHLRQDSWQGGGGAHAGAHLRNLLWGRSGFASKQAGLRSWEWLCRPPRTTAPPPRG